MGQHIVFTLFLLFLHTHVIISCNETDEDIINDGGDMLFLLYTRKNPLREQFFEINDVEHLRETNFDTNKKVKIVIHGWKGSYKSSFGILIKNTFLIQYDANVIVVDWERDARKLWYNSSRSKVPSVGRVVAYMIDRLVQKLGVDPDDIHIVGHSLGAHVAGIAGLLSTFRKVGRVTGLDPAGPLFSYEDKLRLSTDSAKFVDVIHTDAYAAGFPGNLGHVDFYPNGGFAVQPGCGIDLATLKSHRRAYWLFAESIITPGGFKAISCPNWTSFKEDRCPINSTITEMGEHVSKDARGSFYLVTNYKTPFALGNSSLEYDSTSMEGSFL